MLIDLRCPNCNDSISQVIVTVSENIVTCTCNYCGHEEPDLDEFVVEICKCCKQRV